MTASTWAPRYQCHHLQGEGGGGLHLAVPARLLESFVRRQLFAALSPPELETIRAVLERARHEAETGDRAHEDQLRRAEEEVERARDCLRQGQELGWDPLVLNDLQLGLADALRRLDDLRRIVRRPPPTVTDTDAAELAALCARFDELWSAPTTTNEDRQRLLQAAFKHVVIHRVTPAALDLELVWAGGARERHQAPRAPELRDQIGELADQGASAPEIVARLSAEGITTSAGTELSYDYVANILRRLHLHRSARWRQALPVIHDLRRQRTPARRIAAILTERGIGHPLGEWTEQRVYGAIKHLRRRGHKLGLELPPWSPLTRRVTTWIRGGASPEELLSKLLDACTGRPNQKDAVRRILATLRRQGTLPDRYAATLQAWLARRAPRPPRTSPEVLERMHAARLAGKTWPEVAEDLSRSGLRSATGRRFTVSTVWYLARRHRRRVTDPRTLGPDGRRVLKSELGSLELAKFFEERGVASRGDYLRQFAGRFSERVLDPARRLLVAEGHLIPVQARRGLPSVWRWNP